MRSHVLYVQRCASCEHAADAEARRTGSLRLAPSVDNNIKDTCLQCTS
jgi:hypothetical protein